MSSNIHKNANNVTFSLISTFKKNLIDGHCKLIIIAKQRK